MGRSSDTCCKLLVGFTAGHAREKARHEKTDEKRNVCIVSGKHARGAELLEGL